MGKKLFTSLLCPSTKVTEEQLESDVNLLNMERSILAMNRRSFLGTLGAVGAAAATMGVAGGATKAEAQSLTPTVLDVLNFALNLEYFEASFYLWATGQPALSSSVTGVNGATYKGFPSSPPALDSPTMATAKELAANEVAHVLLLQSAITSAGGTPVAMPMVDYSANGTVTYTTQAQFLTAARQFEAVGASAYAGAADLLYDLSLLTTAAQILGTESQHLGAINYLCNANGLTLTPFDPFDYPPVPPSGSNIGSYFTITPPASPVSLYGEQEALAGTPYDDNTTSTGIAQPGPAIGAARAANLVLAILYGAATDSSTTNPWPTGVKSGGFFPNGVNGGITSS